MTKSEYAGRTMTDKELADARFEVEQWAYKTYCKENPKMYDDICHLCTLAQGMWFKSKKS